MSDEAVTETLAARVRTIRERTQAEPAVHEALSEVETALSGLGAKLDGASVRAGWQERLDGPEYVPAEYRAKVAAKYAQEARKGAEDAAADLEAAVAVTELALREATHPKDPKLPAGDVSLLREEVRMVLDQADPASLALAMDEVVATYGHESPHTAVLFGTWGRAYALSRGNVDAHGTFRNLVEERAADRATGPARGAGQALRSFREAQLNGAGAMARSLVNVTYANALPKSAWTTPPADEAPHPSWEHVTTDAQGRRVNAQTGRLL